jgi:hypothetical protein
MEIKEYRVVCSRPKFGGKIIVDIAPSHGVIHDQIFFSRQWLYKKQTGQDLVKYNYSIMLRDNGAGEPYIQFPAELNSSVQTEAARIRQRDYDELAPEILKAYQEMRAGGLESTLYVYSGAEQSVLEEQNKTPEEEAFDRKQRAKRARFTEPVSYREKHDSTHIQKEEKMYPQNLQQEENMRMRNEFKHACQQRILAEQYRACQTMSAWQRFQKDYSGD